MKRVMDPLDIYFTKPRSGFGKMVDVVQKIIFGKSSGVHMAIIINRECFDHPSLLYGVWYVMESTFHKHPDSYNHTSSLDCIDGIIKDGFQIRPLSSLISESERNGTKSFFTKLRNNPWHKPYMREFVKQRVMDLYIEYKDFKYQAAPTHLLAPVMSCFIPIRGEENNKIFCSQLVCILYQKLFVIKKLYANGTAIAPEIILGDSLLLIDPIEII